MDDGGRGHHEVGGGVLIHIVRRAVDHVLVEELDQPSEVHLRATHMDQWPISYAQMAEKMVRVL